MSKRNQYIPLFLMYLLSTAMALYFLMQNKLPLSWDQSGYMEVSAQIGHALRSLHLFQAAKIFIWHTTWANRPAMYMLIGGIFAAITNFNINLTLILANMFWVGLIIFFTYKFSEHLKFGSGLLSVFLLISSYSTIFLYRDFLSDLGLMCGVVLVEYSFFKSKNLRNQKWSIITLGCMIFGALIKETFVLYVFPIFMYSTYVLLYQQAYRDKRYLKNYFLVYIVSALIVLAFYVPIIAPLLKNMFDNVGDKVGHFYARSYVKGSLDYYLVYLYELSFITSVLYLIIPAIGFIIDAVKNKKSFNINSTNAVILLLLVTPVFVLTVFVVDTDYRFIIPILPLILISCSCLVQSLSHKLRAIIIGLLLAIGVVNLITAVVPIKAIPRSINMGKIILFNQYYYSDSMASIMFGFKNIDFDYSGVVKDAIATLNVYNTKGDNIGVLINKPRLNPNIFRAYAAMNYPRLSFYSFNNITALSDFGYVITTDGELTEDAKDDKKILNKTNRFIMSGIKSGRYNIIKTITMPDKNHLFIIDVGRLHPIYKINVSLSKDMVMAIDSFDITKNQISISGWGFLPNQDAANSKIYLRLSSNGKHYDYLLNQNLRPDLFNTFKNAGSHITIAGFKGVLDEPNDLPHGLYTISIIIVNGKLAGKKDYYHFKY